MRELVLHVYYHDEQQIHHGLHGLSSMCVIMLCMSSFPFLRHFHAHFDKHDRPMCGLKTHDAHAARIILCVCFKRIQNFVVFFPCTILPRICFILAYFLVTFSSR